MNLEEARNTSIEDEMGLGPVDAAPVERGLENASFGIARGAGKLVGGSCRMVTALSQRVKLCGQRIAGLQDRQARQDTQLQTLELDNSALRDDLETFNFQAEEGRQLNAILCEQVSGLKDNLDSARAELDALQKQAEAGSPTPSPQVEDLKKENEFLRLELEKAWAQASEINYKNGVLSQRVSTFETQLACTQGQLEQAKAPGASSKPEPTPADPESKEPLPQTAEVTSTVPEPGEDAEEAGQVSAAEPVSEPLEEEPPQTPEDSSTAPEPSEDATQVSADEPVSEPNEGETPQTAEDTSTAPESSEATAQVSEDESVSEADQGDIPQTPEDSPAVSESSEDTEEAGQVTADEPVSESREEDTPQTPEETSTVSQPVFEPDAQDTPQAPEDVQVSESSDENHIPKAEDLSVPEADEETPQVFPETLPAADEIESAVFAASTDKIVFKKALKDLANQDSTMRVDGANALGYILHELSVRVLTFYLQDEPAAAVRAEIINALAKIGKEQAEPAVELALSDSHATVRLAAVRGVYRLAGDAAADLLIRMFTDEDESVRRRAAVCLGWLESPELAPALIPLIGDVSVSVRQSAIEAVASLRNRETIPALIDQMDDPEESIRLLIVETLKSISGKDMPKNFPKNRTAYLRLIARWRQWWQDQNAEASDEETD